MRESLELADLGCDASYKVLLLGESGVGKTALLTALQGKPVNGKYLATVGMDFVEKTFQVEGAKVKMRIWDTAGQERFRSLCRKQYSGTKGLLLVYDLTDRKTFDMLPYWLSLIDKEVEPNDPNPIPVFIIGNKMDLTNLRAVPTNQGKRLSDQHYVHGFVETSAKDGKNVASVFNELASALVEIYNPKLLLSRQSLQDRVIQQQALIEQLQLEKETLGKAIEKKPRRRKLLPDKGEQNGDKPTKNTEDKEKKEKPKKEEDKKEKDKKEKPSDGIHLNSSAHVDIKPGTINLKCCVIS